MKMLRVKVLRFAVLVFYSVIQLRVWRYFFLLLIFLAKFSCDLIVYFNGAASEGPLESAEKALIVCRVRAVGKKAAIFQHWRLRQIQVLPCVAR